jgi:hypothetical protein
MVKQTFLIQIKSDVYNLKEKNFSCDEVDDDF